MTRKQKYSPVYKQFVDFVSAGFDLLDENTQQEIRQFIIDNQHHDGAFCDRGSAPDLYYSLFGLWLSSSLSLDESLEKLKQYVPSGKKEAKTTIDHFSISLIEMGLDLGKPSLRFLFRWFRSNSYLGNFSYKVFLFLLFFDARYQQMTFAKFILRAWLMAYKPPEDSPTSLLAALLIARTETGMNTQKLQKKLKSHYDSNHGFMSFVQMQASDMLSTAVALFALRKAGFDLRLMAPSCLAFIQLNYDRGAFLSGDGDNTRDLEYTFYGLLALGVLSQKSN